jgi:two-component system KDP operon response regulator KdpE
MNRMALIVEDDAATRRGLGVLFARRGWDVRSTSTVAGALALLGHAPPPDFLLLDLGLPDGAGEAVLEVVKGAGLGTRVVVCTGTADPLRLIRLRALGPDLTLFKPLDPDVICRLCESWTA